MPNLHKSNMSDILFVNHNFLYKFSANKANDFDSKIIFWYYNSGAKDTMIHDQKLHFKVKIMKFVFYIYIYR